MYKFIRNHQKKFLALFMVLLMVIFIIPPSMKNGRGYNDRIVGHIGSDPVYASERQQSERDWQMLSRIPLPELNAQGQPVPLTAYLGRSLIEQMPKHPELFLLLQREATKAGVVVDDQTVDGFMTQYMLDLESDQTPDAQAARKQAVHGLLLVAGLRDLLGSGVKYTDPMWTHLLADNTQKVRLSVVTFRADQFKGMVPPPAPAAVRKQYDLFSHAIATADSPLDPAFAPEQSADNPLGFGYELPRRVKFQSVGIRRRDLLDAVAAEKSAYEWEVEARKYYYSHQDDYPSTQPQPTGANPATLPAAPTTQPYIEVRQNILDQLRGPDADLLAAKLRAAVLARLDSDYAALEATDATTRPDFGPGAPAPQSATAGLVSGQYLQHLAAEMQKQFKVLPIVTQVSDWEDSDALSHELGIGQAKTSDQKSFADYAIGSDDPAAAKNNLKPFQPSTWLADADQDSYIFRLTDVASATPAPFESVQATATADVVTQQAFEKALQSAKDLSAKTKSHMLRAVATANGLPAFLTDYFQPGRGEIPGAIVDSKAQRLVEAEAERLLSIATPDEPHPLGIVQVPALRSVILVQLSGLESTLPPGDLWRAQLSEFGRVEQRQTEQLADQYFDYDAVAQRMDYHPAEQENSS